MRAWASAAWPLVLGYPWRHEEQVTYRLPNGTRILRLPGAHGDQPVRPVHPDSLADQQGIDIDSVLVVNRSRIETAELSRLSRLPARLPTPRWPIGWSLRWRSAIRTVSARRRREPCVLLAAMLLALPARAPGRRRTPRRPRPIRLGAGWLSPRARPSGAANSFRRALAHDPADARALFGIANLAYRARRRRRRALGRPRLCSSPRAGTRWHCAGAGRGDSLARAAPAVGDSRAAAPPRSGSSRLPRSVCPGRQGTRLRWSSWTSLASARTASLLATVSANAGCAPSLAYVG